MQKYDFKIKVSDLLLDIWKKDTVFFENKKSKQLKKITEWINGEVVIQSLDKQSILVNLKKITSNIEDKCDKCWSDFKRKIIIKNYKAKFMFPEIHHDITEEIHDEEYLINKKDETIDIEDMIVQSIILEEPIIKKCNKCLNKKDENTEDEKDININKINWINVEKK